MLRRLFFSALSIALGLAPVAAQDVPAYRLLKLDGRNVKWGAPEFGVGAVVTYAFVAEAVAFNDAINCQAMGPVDPILAFNGVAPEAFDRAVAQAFAAWESVSNVRFEKSATPTDAGILIGVDLGNRGWAHADVRTPPSDAAIGAISRGLVCLSTEKQWKIGFGNNPDAQDLQYTLTHEIGHAIGLNHASPKGALMSFTYSEDVGDLQPGDVAGAQTLYGAPQPALSAMSEAIASEAGAVTAN